MGKLNPPPVRQPIPILIGGGGPKRTLKLVARHAQHLALVRQPRRGPREARDPRRALRGRGPRPGRDRASRGARRTATGTSCVDAGVTHLILGVSGSDSGYDLGPPARARAVEGRAVIVDESTEFGARVAAAPADEIVVWMTTVAPSRRPAADAGVVPVGGRRDRCGCSAARARACATSRRTRTCRSTSTATGAAAGSSCSPAARRSTATARARTRSAPTSRSTPTTSSGSATRPSRSAATYSVPVRIELTKLRGH